MSSADHDEMWKVNWSTWLGGGTKKPGAHFSKPPVITGPVKLFYFPLIDTIFKSFKICTVKLSAKETIWTSYFLLFLRLWFQNMPDFGPVKLPGLSRNGPQNPWPREHRAIALSTELRELMESKVILLSSHVRGVLHTARISTVEVIVNSDKLIKKTVLRKHARWLVKNRVGITRWRHRASVRCWRSDGASKENLHFDNQS